MNMAPLIDVVFLLLIFFVVASTLDTNEISATIQLPQVDMETSTEENVATLYLDKNGFLYVEDKSIAWDMLQNYFQTIYSDFPAGIEVYADKEVNFEYIARVMAVANRINIEQISFLLELGKAH